MAYTTSSTLLQKIASGDEVSWQEFYLRYAPFIQGIAVRFSFPPCDTDELLQQTMIKIFSNDAVARFDRSKGNFRSYLHTIVRHKIIDIVRRRRNEELPDEIPVEQKFGEVFDDAYGKYLLNLAFDALKAEVNPTTFEAFCLLTRNEMPPKQVAETLDISLDSVYAAKSRCAKKITRLLQELGGDAPDVTP
ncbi:MAG: sigma-70 family RNA polymerase sigma factor [Victivallaceae bacterium]|nr:sigma-70 family RNA polymerase sigma factor [Victivallaceae bacterium]